MIKVNLGLTFENFCFSWVKKNVKETYGGDEEVSVVSQACSKRRATAVPNFNQFDPAVA